MNKRAQDRIERIMGDAFEQAAQVLDAEWRKPLQAKPERYSRFVLAVVWGPTLFDASGQIIKEHEDKCCPRAKQMLAYSDKFYDKFGADNRQVTA